MESLLMVILLLLAAASEAAPGSFGQATRGHRGLVCSTDLAGYEALFPGFSCTCESTLRALCTADCDTCDTSTGLCWSTAYEITDNGWNNTKSIYTFTNSGGGVNVGDEVRFSYGQSIFFGWTCGVSFNGDTACSCNGFDVGDHEAEEVKVYEDASCATFTYCFDGNYIYDTCDGDTNLSAEAFRRLNPLVGNTDDFEDSCPLPAQTPRPTQRPTPRPSPRPSPRPAAPRPSQRPSLRPTPGTTWDSTLDSTFFESEGNTSPDWLNDAMTAVPSPPAHAPQQPDLAPAIDDMVDIFWDKIQDTDP